MGISLDMDLKVIANWVIRMLLVTSLFNHAYHL